MFSKRFVATLFALLALSALPAVSVAQDAMSPEDVQKAVNVCNKTLAALKKVPAAKVAAFSGNSWVLPLCQVGAEVRAAKLDDSKVAGLIGAIAGNAGLMQTLKSKGYKTEDLVGFSLSVDGARMFVHRR